MNRPSQVSRTPTIPEGLADLMSEISREVIKHRPTSMLEFIADYLEAKLKAREMDKTVNRYVDNVLTTAIKNILDNYGIDIEVAIQAATAIQALFRGYRVRKMLKLKQRDEHEDDTSTEIMNIVYAFDDTSIKYLKSSDTSVAESAVYEMELKMQHATETQHASEMRHTIEDDDETSDNLYTRRFSATSTQSNRSEYIPLTKATILTNLPIVESSTSRSNDSSTNLPTVE